ncbi:MAG: zinc ribbon domain-containing protein [bacterium]|nr:zinc ribbon domain-containing protein [bacterium]
MPMYEFACRACGAEFEELCTAAEAAAGKVGCPACGARKSERKLSTFASKDAAAAAAAVAATAATAGSAEPARTGIRAEGARGAPFFFPVRRDAAGRPPINELSCSVNSRYRRRPLFACRSAGEPLPEDER